MINRDIFAKERTWDRGKQPSPPPRLPRRPLFIAAAVAVATILVVVVLAIWYVATRPPSMVPGVAQALVGSQHVLLRDYPDRPWITFSNDYKSFLGDPIWPEQVYRGIPDCVGYQNYITCASSDPQVASTVFQFQPLPLGTQSLARTRKTPKPDAPIAPIVQQYFNRITQDAVTEGQNAFGSESDFIRYWFGRSESDPECVAGPSGTTGQCLQVFERQVLRWPQGSNDPRSVQLWPLGTEAPRP